MARVGRHLHSHKPRRRVYGTAAAAALMLAFVLLMPTAGRRQSVSPARSSDATTEATPNTTAHSRQEPPASQDTNADSQAHAAAADEDPLAETEDAAGGISSSDTELPSDAFTVDGDSSNDSSSSAGGSSTSTSTSSQPESSSDSGSSGSGSSSGSGGSGSADIHTGIFFEVPGPEGQPSSRMEMLNEQVPEDCYMEQHADYDGPSLTWGLSYKKASAAQCCQACKELKTPREDGTRCNIWVWCGSPTGECWSPDIWNHTTGECWLKYQEGWDNNIDRLATNLVVNKRGKYEAEFRAIHTTAPDEVPWTAGVIPA